MSTKRKSPTAPPPKPAYHMPACLAPAMLEWALEQPPEERDRLLKLPARPCREGRPPEPGKTGG